MSTAMFTTAGNAFSTASAMKLRERGPFVLPLLASINARLSTDRRIDQLARSDRQNRPGSIYKKFLLRTRTSRIRLDAGAYRRRQPCSGQRVRRHKQRPALPLNGHVRGRPTGPPRPALPRPRPHCRSPILCLPHLYRFSNEYFIHYYWRVFRRESEVFCGDCPIL